jgi:monovalent cation:H+ antiporter-2, CPA2 family
MATDLFIVIAAGFCGGVLARLLRQPLVLGYLVAGIAVGPHTGGISVGDPQNLERLAEIGATLLLFGLGLELSLKDLAPVRRVALLGTPIQVALTMAVAWPLGAWLGLGWVEAVWLGALVSLSSTLVVLKALQSQGRIGTLSSRVMLGMLVAQDLAFIPLMIVLPRLGSSDAGTSAALLAVLKAGLLLAALLTVGTRAIPRLVEWVARSGSRELFLLVTMGLALGIGYLTHEFGVSSAVGAFVAGLVLSESEYSHQALSDIIPLRDVFSLLFFASVGMLLDPTHVLGQWRAIAVVVIVISLSKGAIFAGVTRAFGYRNVVPLAAGLGLFGIGEFSFVLARTGFDAGAISAGLYALVLNTAVITMVLTPIVSGLTTPVYGWVSRRRGREPVMTINVQESALAGHIVVAGAGRVGCRVAEVLRSLGLPFVVVELDHRRLDYAKERAFPTIFGDAAQPVVLEAAGIERARLVLVTIPVLGVAMAVVEHARRLNPAVDIVVRAESADAVASLRAVGVAEVVQPDLEASLEMTRQALVHLRMSPLDIVQLTDRLRAEHSEKAARST